MSLLKRRQSSSRSGRSTPVNSPTCSLSLESSKGAKGQLYQIDLPDPASPIVSASSSVFPTCTPSRPSTTVPSTSSIRFPQIAPSLNPTHFPSSRRAPTPPPPYKEQPVSLEDVSAQDASSIPRRSRTSSASSWIRRVISRSSSRVSLRRQYDQIPPSDEERNEQERVKALKAQQALLEWNQINEALSKAGF